MRQGETERINGGQSGCMDGHRKGKVYNFRNQGLSSSEGHDGEHYVARHLMMMMNLWKYIKMFGSIYRSH